MNSEEHYTAALHDLAVEIGVDAAEFIERQELIVDGASISFSLAKDTLGGSVISACRVGPLPANPSPELLRFILQANTLGEPTSGATFGMQHAGEYLVLARHDALDTPAARLSRACNKLASMAAVWTTAITRGLDLAQPNNNSQNLSRQESVMSRYQQLLENYARGVGLEPVDAFLASQEIVIGGVTVGLTLDGDENNGDVVFFSNLGQPAPDAAGTNLNVMMLQANALWAGTGGCTLGLQPDTGAVLLSGRAPLALCDAAALASALDAFADLAVLWRNVVSGKTRPELPALAATAA
jgi:hypothetical protein